MTQLWSGRFTKPMHEHMREFSASIHFDQELAMYDILGSLAHIKMLQKCGILSTNEEQKIAQGLQKIAKQIQQNKDSFSTQDEDIHLNIERMLLLEIGDLAGKLHTARSRNDQVALDLHLYLRDQMLQIIDLLSRLQQTLLVKAKSHIKTILPGYTHLQRAQPVNLAQHLLVYFFMLQRDIERFMTSWSEINKLPLGAGALAGSSFNVDRHFLMEILNFDGLYENTMDAVSDRDFVVVFLTNASLVMMHLSRLSEELIIWSSDEFGFIEFDDAFSSGSSMMPQKKNPDVAELTRGKTGRVYGSLMSLLTVLKGLPLCYNRDLQEDKEGLFDTVKTLKSVLTVYEPMIETMIIKQQNMLAAASSGFINATDLAEYLVKKGTPFRQAHHIVGQIVQYCLITNQLLTDLPLEQYLTFSTVFEQDLYQAINLEHAVNSRTVIGSSGKEAINQQIQSAQNKIEITHAWLQVQIKKIRFTL